MQVIKIIKRIIYITIMIMTACLIAIMANTRLSTRGIMSDRGIYGGYIGGYKILFATSKSMEPSMIINSISLVYKCDIQNIETGDIILYHTKVGVVTHRVIDIDIINGDVYLLTKGDANKEPDGILADKKTYEGKIVYTSNGMALIISFFNTDGNVVAAMYKIVIALIMVVLVIYTLWQPIIKQIKSVYIQVRKKKCTIELNELQNMKKYKQSMECIREQLNKKETSIARKIMFSINFGRALESIDEIENSINALEKRIEKMNKHSNSK